MSELLATAPLSARGRLAGSLLTGRSSRDLRRLALHEVIDELGGRIRHLDLEALDLVEEHVVEPHRRNGDEEAQGGRDESFRDAGRHRAEAAGPGRRHAAEGVDDADDGAEKADERRRRRDRGETAAVSYTHLRAHETVLDL